MTAQNALNDHRPAAGTRRPATGDAFGRTVLPGGSHLYRVTAFGADRRRHTLTIMADSQDSVHATVARIINSEPLWCSCCRIKSSMTLRETRTAIAAAAARYESADSTPDLATAPMPLYDLDLQPRQSQSARASLRAWLRRLIG